MDLRNANTVYIGGNFVAQGNLWAGVVHKSTDGGKTWGHRNNSLSTLQFVDIGIHPTGRNVAFGGLEDNAKAK